MHSVCIGIIKRLLELTFNVGVNRARNTTRKLSNPSSYNELMKSQKVPREFSRRARSMDFSVLKAQEMRNICLFLFPHILNCVGNAKEGTLWLNLSFMIRACIIPDNEFLNCDTRCIEQCCDTFYKLYEQLFGKTNCSYTIHIICSHLLRMRAKGPLTDTSAFKFESFYGELRNSFQPGTISPLKQMLQAVLLKRTLGYHCCQLSIHYSPKDTALECNSLIYTFENNTYKCFICLLYTSPSPRD